MAIGKEKNKMILSAEFKRDYVASAAKISFVLILLLEIFLAVSIPWYLHRENTMAHQVLRLQLLDRFDSLRNMMNNVKPRTESAAAELKILRWNTNLLADYLRKESDNLTTDEIKELLDVVQRTFRNAGMISRGRNFVRSNEISTVKYVDSIIAVNKGGADVKK